MQLSIEIVESWVGYSVVMFSVVLREAIGLLNVKLLDTGVVRGSVMVCSVAMLDCMLLDSVLACASEVLGNDVVLDSCEANSMGSVSLSSMGSMASATRPRQRLTNCPPPSPVETVAGSCHQCRISTRRSARIWWNP